MPETVQIPSLKHDGQIPAYVEGDLILTESLAITLSAPVGYHPYDPPFVFGEDYTKANLPTVYRQMEKAGVRLAWVLTQAWK